MLGVFSSCFTDILYFLLASSFGAFYGWRLPAFITATRNLNGSKMLLIGIWQMDVRTSRVKITAIQLHCEVAGCQFVTAFPLNSCHPGPCELVAPLLQLGADT